MSVSELKLTRASYEKKEAQFLASYAMKVADSQGRRYPEEGHALRTPFQRDRDRIIHSTAFRRLQYKTQVFVNYEGDHFRTRLTHTIEACQIARSIARVLRLNEDLVEAIALAHDLGHGPFGHAGEWVLQEMMKDSGGFEHNRQCVRIVESLENPYPDFPGLNLTFETREGLKKHAEPDESPTEKRFRTLEAELVDLADEIAYNSHDLDDGLRAGLLSEEQVMTLPVWCEIDEEVSLKRPDLAPGKKRRLVIRELINRLVADVVETTVTRIEAQGIENIGDLQAGQERLVSFSEPMQVVHHQLKAFLSANLYRHYLVTRMTDKGQRFVKALFQLFREHPEQLPQEVQGRVQTEGIDRAICDYVSGMTDRYAMDEYRRLFEPHERFF